MAKHARIEIASSKIRDPKKIANTLDKNLPRLGGDAANGECFQVITKRGNEASSLRMLGSHRQRQFYVASYVVALGGQIWQNTLENHGTRMGRVPNEVEVCPQDTVDGGQIKIKRLHFLFLERLKVEEWELKFDNAMPRDKAKVFFQL